MCSRSNRIQIVTLTLLTCFYVPSYAQETQLSRPLIGLALSGGGARGFAHIGVLQWFEEHRIPVDYIGGGERKDVRTAGHLVSRYNRQCGCAYSRNKSFCTLSIHPGQSRGG